MRRRSRAFAANLRFFLTCGATCLEPRRRPVPGADELVLLPHSLALMLSSSPSEPSSNSSRKSSSSHGMLHCTGISIAGLQSSMYAICGAIEYVTFNSWYSAGLVDRKLLSGLGVCHPSELYAGICVVVGVSLKVLWYMGCMLKLFHCASTKQSEDAREAVSSLQVETSQYCKLQFQTHLMKCFQICNIEDQYLGGPNNLTMDHQ